MFCPKCGAEYREGFSECSDCHVGLVPIVQENMRGKAETSKNDVKDIELVNVFVAANKVSAALASSILEDAGIPYVKKFEGVQDLFGIGSFGTGYNILTGPIIIQVARENESEAIQLLEAFNENKND